MAASADAAPVYDYTRALAEPHPFAQPSDGAPVNPALIHPARFEPHDRRAQHGLYLSTLFFFGPAKIDDSSIDNGQPFVARHDEDYVGGAGMAVGYRWSLLGLPARTELEYAYRVRMDYDTWDQTVVQNVSYENNVSTHSVMLNAYLGYPVSDRLTVYGGGGLGWVRNVSEVTRSDTSDTERTDSTDNLGWNLAVGML